MPFALVQLGIRPAPLDRPQHAAIGVADDPLRLALQGAEQGAPVGRIGAPERLGMPEPGLAGAVADRAEDVEGDSPGGDPPALGVVGPDPERQMVEQQRALGRPGARALRLGDDRREQLDPVGDELAVSGLAQLAGLGVEAKAPGAVAGDAGCLHVGGSSADGCERLRDPAGDELVVARRLRSLATLNPTLAVLARAMPGLLPRQQLGEDVRLAALRRALLALTPMAGPSVAAVQLDLRSPLLRSRTLHPRCADPRHAPRPPPQPDGPAQRDAKGGLMLDG